MISLARERVVERPALDIPRVTVWHVEVHAPDGGSYWRRVTTQDAKSAAERVASALVNLGKGIDGVRIVEHVKASAAPVEP